MWRNNVRKRQSSRGWRCSKNWSSDSCQQSKSPSSFDLLLWKIKQLLERIPNRPSNWEDVWPNLLQIATSRSMENNLWSWNFTYWLQLFCDPQPKPSRSNKNYHVSMEDWKGPSPYSDLETKLQTAKENEGINYHCLDQAPLSPSWIPLVALFNRDWQLHLENCGPRRQ